MAMALHSHSLLCSGRTARRLVPLFVFSTHRSFPRPRTVYFRTSESLLTTQVHDISCRRLTAKAAADDVFSAPELSKNFDFTAEERIYNWWESQGYFKPNIDLDKPPFVISMPPPNVTGALHMGHAMFVTLEDIMTRYWRMKGRPTLWLPGTDHAGIATQLTAFKADLAAQITATMCMYRKNVDSMQTDAKAIAFALLAYVGRGSQFIIV